MGCFTIIRGKKKKSQYSRNKKPVSVSENIGTALPDPEACGPCLQSAPPSFRNLTKQVQLSTRATNNRARALSAPSSLIVADQYVSSSIEFDDQEEMKALPLPLPSPKGNSVLKNMDSFKSSKNGGPVSNSGPLPLPPLGGGGLRNFTYDEIAAACQHFSADRCVSGGISSTVYKATFGDDSVGSKKLETTVTRLMPSSQNLKDFISALNTIASLQHPQLCKLIGFHAREGSDQRMLVYERLYHGSLDRLLYGRSDGPTIDWPGRMKLAICAARGLAFLHEEGPFQAMFHEFSTANIQVDKDFSAKLSGYGSMNYNPEPDIVNTSVASANLSVETLEKGLLTPKSNVWSFGIVLLELLTGKKNLDSRHPKEERNIVKWSKPFLADDCRLSLIMDPRIKGRCPPKAARTVADIAVKCLQKDPSERPTMRSIVEALTNVQDMKCPSCYPLREPSMVVKKQMSKSSSLNGLIVPAPAMYSSPSPPSSMNRPLISPRVSVTVTVPPATCASTLTFEEYRQSSGRKLPSPLPRWPGGVEGF
ncbi:probable serine/threonine-protein kinase PBL1 [Phalaenopsis equestris]|uniref:probable serine/threonine-protein kinase PBL1 n=1 Tax=Phalaenopsis equestris TaxID=78828 RepID=UPI0009E53C0B|nr:probable serine/threonine-protein kinase PBL1 [Phalaenopsis equestris]XP_020596797.1 probable serine/threonine-protein kinase PBL1 [Phalaenopsis equestris]